ncbi:hypothetical protein DL764_001877 [Monosporascus ibericus]|uniref:DNA replication checkpoint mediator MRC1 domain-containing protein n=1 Tax=Monosporascus ibericus TaxID=155417 RepID=A0A4V1XC47_9PEZI|nr:hypothetical protein DL764_001877 [Monosporascus ibericus]
MASTRSPSPAGGNASEPASPGLSPRSKLKAMLAAVDEDSEDDLSGPIDVNTLFKSADNITTSKEGTRPAQNGGDGEDGSEDEEITRPRGRLAARMQASTAKEAQDTPKTPDYAPNATKGLIQRSTESHASNDEDAQIGSEDGEDDINALPRRRIIRPARSRTPEPAPDADQPSSPGLFVTPSAKSTTSRCSGATSDTEDELPANLAKSDRFKALVARKREERLAKEAEEARKQRERAQRMAETMPANSDIDDDDVSDITDDDDGRRLTQGASRPARKASKKALEEMNRETQRLSRSLQLAHEAKTRKKISKASLFERFNFKVEGVAAEKKPASSSRPSTPVSAQQTDVEMGDAGTPPSSPPPPRVPKPASTVPAGSRNGLEMTGGDEGDELLDIAAALAQTKKQEKDKGEVIASPAKPAEAKPKRRVRVKFPPVQANLVKIGSDDELEITDARKSKVDTIFNRLPTKREQESKSMNALRRLANLSSPPKESSRGRTTKPSMTVGELQMSLQQRARAQAKRERERRLEYLRSKGITVQTEEERQREREEVEDIVARARQEVEEIMEREREEAKKARKEKRESGEADPLGWDDSDDDSFQDSGEEEPAEIDLSGSEEEGEDSDQDAVDGHEPATNPMLEDEAEEDGDSEEEEIPDAATENAKAASDDEADEPPTVKPRRSKKHVHIVSDDDDDDHSHDQVKATPQRKKAHPKSPSAPNSDSPKVPTSVLRSATKTFIPGLPIAAAAPAGLGLTQIFAGTMDDSQAGPASAAPQEFMPSLDNFPDSQFSAKVGQSQTDDNVPDSQPTQNATTQGRETQTQGVQLHFSQSQRQGIDSLMETDSTQISDLIDPTQDGGYQNFTPLKQRFVDAPHSTIETVMLDGTRAEENVQVSPLVRRAGKLRRRREASISTTSLPPTDIPGSPSTAPSATAPNEVFVTGNENTENVDRSAFKLMEKEAKRKKRLEEKLRKKISEAKEWVEQEAEESEDEYAGLGGADGEDSSEDDEELAKEMIDDTAGNDADEAKLAGFFADRERAADAAHVDKLFRDITTGMLRKRRRGADGNDFDLSDSDDGGEAKRRMKRRQFAKMQKALFADERIGKIAENPRNAAFLKSIEDRNSDDEWDFGENFETTADDSESQSQPQEGQQQQEEAIPDSQPTNMGRKRTRMDDHASRPAPHTRRMGGVPRPSSLTEVKRSLSTLLDEPNGSVVPATEAGSDSEGEDDCPPAGVNKENRRSSNFTVVDRIALKRNSSSNLSNSSRLAFTASSATAAAGSGAFKVPALLRKATTNSLISNSSSSSVGSANTGASSLAAPGKAGFNGGGGEDAKLKKTAGRGSGVNYFARENERRAAVAEAEKRREKRKWKSVEGQKKVVTGLFGAGKFE